MTISGRSIGISSERLALDLVQKGEPGPAANTNHRDAGFDGRFRKLAAGPWR